MTWSRVVPGAALLAAVAYAAVSSGSAVLEGHWAYLAWLVAMTVAGGLLVGWGLLGRRPRGGRVRGLFRWVAAALSVGLAAATVWLAPYPADPVPAATTQSSATGLLLRPEDARSTGVAFIPGALIDPRAYQRIFEPVVAAGYPVFIAKPAFGLAFAVPDVVAAAEAADPAVEEWVVAGHSLGGAVASQQTDSAVGLILLGSYPIDDLSGADVAVLSVSGGNDALTTPADIEASRTDLPADTQFVVIEGGIHAYFGDYGTQRGDGQPGVSRVQAQRQTQQAMLAFLGRIS